MAELTMPTAPPNMDAIRRKVQSQLGVDQSKIAAMPYDPSWDTAATQAYGALGSKLSANDLSAQRLRQDYETNFAQQKLNQENAYSRLRNNFANNGTLFSGAYVDEMANQGRDYSNIYDQLARTRSRGIEDISRSNSAAMTDYQNALASAGSGYGASVAKYLQEQAQAQASQSQGQAQLAGLRQMNQDQSMWQKNLYDALQRAMSGPGGIL